MSLHGLVFVLDVHNVVVSQI